MIKFYLSLVFISVLTFAEAQTASFTFQSSNGVFCNPSTVYFTPTASGTPLGYNWDFGNGQQSDVSNPSVVYVQPRNYLVKLVVVYNNTTTETSQTIVINTSVTATLTADRNYLCTPGVINFTAGGNGNFSSYQWDFGDGTTTTTTTPTTAHGYSSFGNYSISVKAVDGGGCFGIAIYSVNVQTAPLSGSVAPIVGCIPAVANFNVSAIIPSGDAINNYSWNFGDGSATTNTSLNSTSYAYNNTGNYLPTVTITTNDGCTSTYSFSPLAFGTPPTNLSSYSTKTQYCGSDDDTLIAKATLANSYIWDYGDGTVEKKLDTITTHRYSRLGLKTITVTSMFNGCPGETQTLQVNVIGVISSFNYQNTCNTPNRFNFTNSSEGNQSSVSWNFGDGTPLSAATNEVHSFPLSGSFNVSLAIIDNVTGCGDVHYENIYTAQPTLFNPDTFVCRNSVSVFSIQNNYTNPNAMYSWSALGEISEASTAPLFPVRPANFGNYAANMVIIDNGPQYCPDTVQLTRAIIVKGPNLSFTAAGNTCVNAAFLINNTSTPYVSSDPIVLSYWNYGRIAQNDTIFQPGVIRYPGPGNYIIKLVAKDRAGCVDSLSSPVTVFPTPFLRIFPRTLSLCQGKSDTLIAYHSDTLSWSPAGSVSSTVKDTILVNPSSNMNIYAVASNGYGCSIRDSSVITVFSPFTSKAMSSLPAVCMNTPVTLSATPAGKKIVWTPYTTLSDSASYTVIATPLASTTYTATLTDSLNCYSSTSTVRVLVKTIPVVDAGPDQVIPFGSNFTISPKYTGNITSYSWTPPGNLNCTDCPATSGSAYQSQLYTVKVISDSGCVAQDAVNIIIECKYANLFMPAAFTPNGDGLNDIFYPMTRGIKKITRFSVYDRTGRLMFEAKDFSPNDRGFGWNGRYKGAEQQGGTYVYILEGICDQNENLSKKGTIMLLR